MKKEDVLGHLRIAKSAHVKWVQKAKLLISGVDVDEESIPVDSTECKFGKWFYNEGQMLNALSNNPLECMKNIEDLHFALHDMYLNIYNVYFLQEKKKGFFATIFGSRKKTISEAEQTLAQSYYEKMEKISHDLLDEINRLERRLIAISDSKIEALI